ncbi:MAG: methyltransferase domain-containing protein [Chloroflexota bacterium]|nr:methyltransferase domain-containing protein [Chloroflexota bacterium]
MSAFDTLAPTYDTDFTASPIARHLRDRVHARLDALTQTGQVALELGCGTGEDALHLAQRGVHITATDASDAMLTITRQKLFGFPNASVEKIDLSTLSTEYKVQSAALVYANFGVLNCLSDWQPLAAWLADRVVSGGHIAFGIMSPFCVWEPLWHGMHGDWRTATRRWRREGTEFKVPNSSLIYYPTIRRLTRDFAPWFRRTHVEPLGVFLPPSDVYGVLEKRPRLLKTLLRLDARIGRMRWLALAADHYWIEFERRA